MKKFVGVCTMAMLFVMGTNGVAPAWILVPFHLRDPHFFSTYSGNGFVRPWNNVKLRTIDGFPQYPNTANSSFKFDDVYLLSPMGLYYPLDEFSRRIQPSASLRPLAAFGPNKSWESGMKIVLPPNISGANWRYSGEGYGRQFPLMGYSAPGYYFPHEIDWSKNRYMLPKEHSPSGYALSPRSWWPEASPLSPEEAALRRDADKLNIPQAVTIKSDTSK